jgi:cell division septum initiation protein DivIVA
VSATGGTPPIGRRELHDLEGRRRALGTTWIGAGYGATEVDRFLDQVLEGLRDLALENEALRSGLAPESVTDRVGTRRLTALAVQDVRFPLVRFGQAYRMRSLDEFLDDVTDLLNGLLAENEALRAGSGPT